LPRKILLRHWRKRCSVVTFALFAFNRFNHLRRVLACRGSHRFIENEKSLLKDCVIVTELVSSRWVTYVAPNEKLYFALGLCQCACSLIRAVICPIKRPDMVADGVVCVRVGYGFCVANLTPPFTFTLLAYLF
jgi:hypothetical protein